MAPKHPLSEAELWERIIHPEGPMSKEAARHIAQIEFSPAEVARMHTLAERNRQGTLTEEESDELDHICRMGTLLAALKLRSHEVLTRVDSR